MDICLTVVVTDEEGGEVITASLQIGLYGDARLFREVDDAELASLTSYGELERLEVHILAVQRCQLRYTQARRVDTL